MSESDDADDSVGLSLVAQIDRLCDEYEAAWRGGQQPRIEDVLKRLPESACGELLRELVRIDVELRWGRGEAPTTEEYVCRFPAYRSSVEAGFAQAPAPKPPESHSLAVDETQSLRHALHIRCPHCHHPIELVDDRPLTEMTCPSCHSKFTLAAGETLDGAGGPAAAVSRPRTLGHFELLEQLGTGGFGTVWKARDTKLDRIVAVKIPRKGNLSADEVEKFLREARTAAQLQHPHIVSVHEIGLENEVIYIVSDFIEGQTLVSSLAQQKPTIREAVELSRKLAEALHYAHEHGVIHRDLKPANVIIDAGGEPHVMDFGLAKREAGEITMTMEGQILGTPAYMSPEQARGEGHAANRRTDVYSLGVILFELLTGERPFRGNARMLLKQVVEDEPSSPRKLDGRIPRDLETICLKCLEKKPERRYATCRELSDELARYLQGEPILARPVSKPERWWRWCRRNPAVASLTSAAGLLLLAVTVVSTSAYFREAHLKSVANRKTQEAQESETKAQGEATRAGHAEADAKREAQHAREEADRATKAETTAEQQRDRARQETEAAERTLYFNRIALAKQYLDEGDLDRVNALLKLCLERFRHWEYHWLAWTARDQTRLLPHDGYLRDAIYSPDGTRIVSADTAGVVKLWDAKTCRNISTFRAHEKAIVSIDYSPDGNELVTASADGTAKIWDLHDGSERLTLTGHDGPLTRPVAFGPDGMRVATSGTDKTLRIWYSATGELLTTIDTSAAPIVDFVWHPDGQHVFELRRDRRICLRNVTTGEVVRTLVEGPYNPEAIGCDATGNLIAAAGNGWALVWDVSGDSPKWIFSADRNLDFRDLALSPDGALIVLQSLSGLLVFDVKTRQCVYRHFMDDAQVHLRPDAGAMLLAPTYGREVVVCPTLIPLFTRQVGSSAKRLVSFSPDGNWVTSEEGIYSLADGTPLRKPGGLLSPNGQYLATWTADRDQKCVILLREAVSSREVRRFEGLLRTPERLAFSPDGRLLAAGCPPDYRIWRVDDGEVVSDRKLKIPAGASMALSPDGRLIAHTGQGGALCVADVATGERICESPASKDFLSALTFSPGGKYLATGGHQYDKTVKVWDASTWKLLYTFRGHEGAVNSLAFTHDESRLASVSHDGTIRLWDLEMGAEILTVRASSHVLMSVAFAPDGRSLATVGDDGILCVLGDVRPRAKPGKSIVLLPLVDPSVDSVQGEWRKEGESLRAVSAKRFDRLVVPLAPQGSYALRSEFTRLRSGRSKTVGFFLPAGVGRTVLCFDHEDRKTSGLDLVNGRGVGDAMNPTNVKPGTLQDDRRYAMKARVALKDQEVTIDVKRDEKPFIHWEGRQNALHVWPGWEVASGDNPLALATGDAEVVFHRLELEMLDGEAVYLRSPPPKPPAGAVVVPAGQTINLLEHVDAKLDAYDVAAKTTDAGVDLLAVPDKPGRVGLPVWPRGDYELAGSFSFSGKESPVLIIPTPRSRCMIHWRRCWVRSSGPISGLEQISGKGVDKTDNPTRSVPSKVEPGRHAFRVQVACAEGEADISVDLDGEPFIHWKGPESELGLWPGFEIPHQRTIGVGMHADSVTYHELTLKMLSGEAWLLRPRR